MEYLTVRAERTTLDLLLWRRYRRDLGGLLEDTLARNPGLASAGAFLPVGMVVAVDAPSALATAPARPVVSLYD